MANNNIIMVGSGVSGVGGTAKTTATATTAVAASVSASCSGINSLRDVCNFLQQSPSSMNPSTLPPGVSAYDHIVDMIRGLDLQDDGIMMNHKIKSIEREFCHIVLDENMLCQSMDYINDKALTDGDTALKFALLFSSRNFDALAMNDTKIRSAMLKILETNFLNADTYRVHDKERLYNSITMLGEYYHRVRLANNSPITILGESLLSLLIREVSEQEIIDVKLAKLILSQITLNGDIMRAKHKDELTQLLYHIRRNLIEQPVLKAAVKALLLMTLDLYYSNFTNLGAQLEEMYTKYLVQEDEDEGNNNMFGTQIHSSPQQLQQTPSQQKQRNYAHQENTSFTESQNIRLPNGENISSEMQVPTKKWSEQVCEDSFLQKEFNKVNNGETEIMGEVDLGAGQQADNLNETQSVDSSRFDSYQDSSSRSARRSHKPRNSPRPLKHQYNEGNAQGSTSPPPHQSQELQQSQRSGSEERDETKPLPRWRAPRFNRDPSAEYKNNRNYNRRHSANFEDDSQSVHSEGGNIRLYSINDRLKHSQEKMERTSGNNFNSIANSNWDRQSQHDDRSERSYISNYERGNYRRGGRHYNNRHTYDKPPRFQKNQQNKDNKIHSESWRRTRKNSNGSCQDENCSYQSNGPESNSRSSSRARTLPRPAKSHMDGAPNTSSSYRRSQSPMQRSQNSKSRYYGNSRYSSQSSLASDASSTIDRQYNQRNYRRGRGQHQHQQRQNQNEHLHHQQPQRQRQEDWEDTHSVHGQPEEESWESKNDNSELVRNARQTTKYMNYLSSKK